MTQNEIILNHLKDFGSITPLEAMNEYGIMRLGARVYDLKRKGYNICGEMISKKNRYGKTVSFSRYYLQDEKR